MKQNHFFFILILAMSLTGCGLSAEQSATMTAMAWTPTPAPTATQDLIQLGSITEIDQYLSKMSSFGLFSGSVLIAHQGDVLLSQGYGLADREQKLSNIPKTRFRIGSLTKQFTAMAILILQVQGKLQVQDFICSYIADCPAAWEDITIHHLLTHTSGIGEIYLWKDYNRTKATPTSPEQLLARLRSLPMDFQPGERYSYSNSGYILLGYIIEQISGQSYEAFLQQAIFTPLNMHDTGVDHNINEVAVGYADQYSTEPADFVDASTEHGAGALYSTVEDLFLWDRALYTEQLVPRAQLEQMFTPHVTIPNRGGATYGYGWRFMNEDGRPVIEHTGMINGFVSIITRYPEDQIVIIILSNQQDNRVDNIRGTISKKLFGED